MHKLRVALNVTNCIWGAIFGSDEMVFVGRSGNSFIFGVEASTEFLDRSIQQLKEYRSSPDVYVRDKENE